MCILVLVGDGCIYSVMYVPNKTDNQYTYNGTHSHTLPNIVVLISFEICLH